LQDIFADPKIYAVLFVSVSLTRLLCAPYWVWKKERAKKEELEQLLVPKLIVRLVLGQGSDASEETKNLRRLISINVANCSAVSVTNCQIKFLQCYVSEPFDLRPGESRSVIIFFIKEDEKHGIYSARVEALSYFKTAIWQRQHTVLTLEEGDYLIEVFSEKSVAVHLKIRLSKDTYWSVDVVSQ
jgi:hypothetical protein